MAPKQFHALRDQLDDGITGVNRYNPNNLDILERMIDAMVVENEYDQDILLTLLKVYQLNPDRYNEAVVRQVLLKTIMQQPSSDFALAKCLIDANRLGSQELRRVLDIGALLDGCDFATFWKLMRGEYTASNDPDEMFKQPAEVPKIVNSIPGFEDAVRIYAAKAIGVTFQTVDKDTLVRLLGRINDTQLKEIAKRFSWEEKDGGKSFFIANHEATVKSRDIDEKLTFDSTRDILLNVPKVCTL